MGDSLDGLETLRSAMTEPQRVGEKAQRDAGHEGHINIC